MKQLKIANILLEESRQFIVEPALVCRATAPFLRRGDDDFWTFEGPGVFDFTTFFNALPIVKWKRYSAAKAYHLHLEVKGCSCSITQTRADSFSWYSEPVESTRRDVAKSSEWQCIDMDIVSSGQDVITGFIIDAKGEFCLRNSYYYVDVETIRPVELALCTTTFKKEDFITHNIALVKERILGSDEPVSKHFTMHVVDNGRTLDARDLEAPGVVIHPNDNVGGAGGFARGMIEAMGQTPKATHVLLMDDDVTISPESIIRTFNLLSIANDEYEDAFVSGAMMNMDEPEVRWEDMGFSSFSGKFFPLKKKARMNVLHELALSEAYEIPDKEPGFEDQAQHYAAWWYCVIPVATIEREGLPLPVFVRCDDVEYSLRCKPKFMTMSGICIWHLSFHMRYNAAVERYQMTRNVFIAKSTTGMAPMSDFLKDLGQNVQLELKKFNYEDAELALDGFEDFLKGPQFIMERGMAEKTFMAANRNKEKLESIGELKKDAEKQGISLSGLTSNDVLRDYRRTIPDRLADFVTINGHRFGTGYVEKDSVAVIDAAGWEYPAGKIRRRDTLVAIDLPNQKGVIRKRDKDRFKQVWERYRKDVKFYQENKERLEAEYAAARGEMTSVAFWKKYLGIG